MVPVEVTTNGTRADGFGYMPGESKSGLNRKEVLTAVTIMVVISLLIAGGVIAAAEWLRPEELFLRRIEIPRCTGVAVEATR